MIQCELCEDDFDLARVSVDTAAPEIGNAQVSSNKLFVRKSGETGKVVLEDYTIEAEHTPYSEKLAQKIAAWLKLEDNDYVKKNLETKILTRASIC